MVRTNTCLDLGSPGKHVKLSSDKVPTRKSFIIKGSLEEILPSYEKLRNVCVHVRAREGK